MSPNIYVHGRTKRWLWRRSFGYDSTSLTQKIPSASETVNQTRNLFAQPTQVEGGQDKGLQVSGLLPETRCRFVPQRGAANNNGGGDSKGGSTMGGSVLDFGWASIGVEIVRTVMLQNTGKSPAVFFVDTAEVKGVSV